MRGESVGHWCDFAANKTQSEETNTHGAKTHTYTAVKSAFPRSARSTFDPRNSLTLTHTQAAHTSTATTVTTTVCALLLMRLSIRVCIRCLSKDLHDEEKSRDAANVVVSQEKENGVAEHVTHEQENGMREG